MVDRLLVLAMWLIWSCSGFPCRGKDSLMRTVSGGNSTNRRVAQAAVRHLIRVFATNAIATNFASECARPHLVRISNLLFPGYRVCFCPKEWIACMASYAGIDVCGDDVRQGSCRERREPNTVQGFHPETGASINGIQNRRSLLLEAPYFLRF